MGFSRGFRPPKDVVEEYMNKLKSTYPDYIELHKTEICTNILVECFNYPYDTSINIETFMMRLKWDLEKLEQMIKADTFLLHKENYDSDEYFHVAGWEFNKNEPEIDKNRVYNICLKEITLWAATLKTNYFENQDNYYTKMEKIEETLEYFKDMMIEFTIFDFINYFKEYEDKSYDEDDEEEYEKTEDCEVVDTLTFDDCCNDTDVLCRRFAEQRKRNQEILDNFDSYKEL